MFCYHSAVTSDREIGHRPSPGRPRRSGTTPRRDRRPHLESLETRITPSTMTWTGTVNGDWMTAGNWASDTVPKANDDLVFPATSSNSKVVNDFPANTQFNTITIQGSGYSLTGSPVNVVNGINANYSSGTSTDSIDTDLENGIVGVNGGGTLNLEGTISGSAGLNLSGGGTLDLTGTETYTGSTVVGDSTLLVDGTTGAVQDNGTLGGNGMVGNVTSVGGTISPGHSGAPAVLQTGSLSLDNNSTFVTELDGSSPGNGTTGYGQVVAAGPVSLGGAKLDVTLATGFTPTVNGRYTIISNTGGSISGNFAGLTEGSTLTISGYNFRISYMGGSAADNVVLTTLPFPSTTTVSASASSTTYGQSVTFTAHVSGNEGNAAGEVAFYDGNPASGGTELSVVNLGSGDLASYTTAANALDVAGSPHQVYAEYLPSPSSSYASSTTTQAASVTVTPATLTVSLTGTITKTYDGNTDATPSADNYQFSGLVGTDTVGVEGTASYDTKDAGTGKTVTVTGLTISGADAGDYVLSQTTASGPVGVIVPATVTVTGVTASNKVYDGTTAATIDTSGATLGGVLTGDAVSLVTGGAVGRFASPDAEPGQRVTITGLSLSGTDAADYTISPTTAATASITPAPLTVTASPETMVYGGTLPSLAFTTSPFVGSDTLSTALTGSLATTATSSSAAGNYKITQGTLAAVNDNYAITFQGATLSIAPAPLTITANSATKVYGAAVPALSVSYSGFVNGDTAASLATPVSLTTTATSSSPVGTYAIDAGGAGSGNYAITYVPGTLTVTKASTSVALFVSPEAIYGDVETITAVVAPVSPGAGSPTGQVTFSVNGTPVLTTAMTSSGMAYFTTSFPTGSDTVTATYSGDANFQSSQSSSSSIAVAPASPGAILTAAPVKNKRGRIVDVTLQAQLVIIAPRSGPVSGLVTFYRRGHAIATEALSDGAASLRIKAARALHKSFVVKYSGSANYDATVSSAIVPTRKSLRAAERS